MQQQIIGDKTVLTKESKDMPYEFMLRTGGGVEVHVEEHFTDPRELSNGAFAIWAQYFSKNQWANTVAQKVNVLSMMADVSTQLSNAEKES